MTSRSIYFAVWALSLIATLGSLFFSEIMKLPPCVLCWYQRIAMYPIAILLPIAILRNECATLRKYLITLSSLGGVVALYHNLLYYHIIPESISPCQKGISCTSRQIEWLGFITIPSMALGAFALITVLLVVEPKKRKLNL